MMIAEVNGALEGVGRRLPARESRGEVGRERADIDPVNAPEHSDVALVPIDDHRSSTDVRVLVARRARSG